MITATENKAIGGAQSNKAFTMPIGDKRGLPLNDPKISVAELERMLDYCVKSIDNPAKEIYLDKNIELRDAVQAELAHRTAA